MSEQQVAYDAKVREIAREVAMFQMDYAWSYIDPAKQEELIDRYSKTTLVACLVLRASVKEILICLWQDFKSLFKKQKK